MHGSCKARGDGSSDARGLGLRQGTVMRLKIALLMCSHMLVDYSIINNENHCLRINVDTAWQDVCIQEPGNMNVPSFKDMQRLTRFTCHFKLQTS